MQSALPAACCHPVVFRVLINGRCPSVFACVPFTRVCPSSACSPYVRVILVIGNASLSDGPPSRWMVPTMRGAHDAGATHPGREPAGKELDSPLGTLVDTIWGDDSAHRLGRKCIDGRWPEWAMVPAYDGERQRPISPVRMPNRVGAPNLGPGLGRCASVRKSSGLVL